MESSNVEKGFEPISMKLSQSAQAWLVCFSASLFFFYEFIQMNVFNAIEAPVVHAFQLNAAQLGFLSSFYFAANVIFLFPAGVMLDRFSTKRIILGSFSLCVLGTYLFSLASTFEVAVVARFLTGIGSAFCFLSCIRLASRWFPSERMALITGLIVTMAMLGGMCAQYPMTVLVNTVGWRQALMYDSILGLFILAIIYKNVQDFPNAAAALREQDSRASEFRFWPSFRIAYLNPQNWLAALYTCLMNTPIGILGVVWGVPYLSTVFGLSNTQAASVTSMIFLGTIFGGPMIGYFSDKYGQRKVPMILGAIASIITIMLFLQMHSATIPALMAIFFALGFFSASQVLTYPCVAENNPTYLTAMAVSVISFTTQGGIWVFEPLFGNLIQRAWDGQVINGVAYYSPETFIHALYIIPAGFVVALLASLLLREK